MSASAAALPPQAAGFVIARQSHESRLHKALLGETHTVLGDRLILDPSSTFEEVEPPGIDVPLTGDGPREFESHTVYHLARDIMMLRNVNELGKIDVVHRFVMRDPMALNDGLTEWALNRERKCMMARRDILAGTERPEQHGDLGKTTASNRGGYQSLSNIFEAWSEAKTGIRWSLAADPLAQQQSSNALQHERIDDPKEVAGRPHLCNLHRVASEALDQACACARLLSFTFNACNCPPHATSASPCPWSDESRRGRSRRESLRLVWPTCLSRQGCVRHVSRQ